MKELSIEEKACRYDKAIERARRYYDEYKTRDNILYVEDMEDIFPELKENKESEGEKIRQFLIHEVMETSDKIMSYRNMNKKDVLTWLEKQGEQTEAQVENNLPSFDEAQGTIIVEKQCEQKSIWHNEDEEPQRGSLILLIMQSGTPIVAKIIEPNHTFNHGERWAYIDDLLEKQGEQILANSTKTCKYGQNTAVVIPKFSVGDIIRPKGSTTEYTIESISGGCYRGHLWRLPIGCDDDYELVKQKSADKVEPKFEIGDLITNGILVGKIDEIHELGYHAYFGDYYADVPDAENWHKWTIQDAKDGDVLVCESGWTCIFKTLVNDETFSSYCFMDNTKWFCETGSECHTLKEEFVKAYNGKIYPATKEQRDLLFQKMHEAGYEWDAEKKELKKLKN